MADPASMLLGADDPAPVTVVNPTGTTPLLILCDHAAASIPAALGTLGLEPAQLDRHIAWDIGAAAVSRLLAARFDATAILSGFSRLVIDCNRALDDPTAIPVESDGVTVPGNQGLDTSARTARIVACYTPYHQAIANALDHFVGRQTVPVVLSIHSFTPTMRGIPRPWQVGVLWDEDPRIPLPLIALLRHTGLAIGDNQPYSAQAPHGFALRHHAARRGWPHVLIELRQDEIAGDAGAARYAEILASALEPILTDPLLYQMAVQR